MQTQDVDPIDAMKLRSAKDKIERKIIQNNMTLSVFFKVLDSDESNSIEIDEFKKKIHGLACGLDDDEIVMMWRKLDKNGDGAITFDELINEFSRLSTEQLVKRLSFTFEQSKIDLLYVFNRWALRDPSHKVMHIPEFEKALKSLINVKLID